MRIEAQFVKSAAGVMDLPRDGLAEVAMVGRSNVGKSSLINALVRGRLARTGGAPGTTRLANIYRVARGGSRSFYLVDLPGYGYARGDVRELETVTEAYFEAVRLKADTTTDRRGVRLQPDGLLALLVVDARHPGLENDVEAWRWLKLTVPETAVVATKIDKLARGQRIRVLGELQSVFDDPVLPVSAATGEGLDELWKLIDRLVNSRNNQHPHHNQRRRRSKATAPPRPDPASRAKASG